MSVSFRILLRLFTFCRFEEALPRHAIGLALSIHFARLRFRNRLLHRSRETRRALPSCRPAAEAALDYRRERGLWSGTSSAADLALRSHEALRASQWQFQSFALLLTSGLPIVRG